MQSHVCYSFPLVYLTLSRQMDGQWLCCAVYVCCAAVCLRDPTLPINRSEITRFPHAVLEVKLSLGQGQTSPAWVQVRGGGGGDQPRTELPLHMFTMGAVAMCELRHCFAPAAS